MSSEHFWRVVDEAIMPHPLGPSGERQVEAVSNSAQPESHPKASWRQGALTATGAGHSQVDFSRERRGCFAGHQRCCDTSGQDRDCHGNSKCIYIIWNSVQQNHPSG